MDEKRSFISLMILMAIRASKSQENSDSGGIKCGTTLSSGTFASAGSLRSYTAPWAVSIGNLDIYLNYEQNEIQTVLSSLSTKWTMTILPLFLNLNPKMGLITSIDSDHMHCALVCHYCCEILMRYFVS